MKYLPTSFIVLIFVQLMLLNSGSVNAEVNAGDDIAESAKRPLITPDNMLWGLKDSIDRIFLSLTFDPHARSEKSVKLAKERLLEFRIMAEEGKIDAAKVAQKSHDQFIDDARKSASEIRDDNKTKEIEKQIEIEREVEDEEDNIEAVKSALEIKIKTRSNLTAEQSMLIESLIKSMENKTGSLKIEINSNKEKIKVEIRNKTGKSEAEIDDDVEEIELRHNITKAEDIKDKSIEEIDDAGEELVDLEEEISKYNITENSILVLFNNSKDQLGAAKVALNESKYGEAYGLANAAGNLAENAREKIERLTERERDDKNKTRNETDNEKEDDDRNRVCIQVITPAKNPKTGECEEFPTPCDVPESWNIVGSCIQAGYNNNTITDMKNNSALCNVDSDCRREFSACSCSYVCRNRYHPLLPDCAVACSDASVANKGIDCYCKDNSCAIKSESKDDSGKCCMIAKGLCKKMESGDDICAGGAIVDCDSIVCNPRVV